MNLKNKKIWMAGAGLAAVALVGFAAPTTARADERHGDRFGDRDHDHDRDRDHDHGDFRFGFSIGTPVAFRPAPAPVVVAPQPCGHWEDRIETVLAEPAHEVTQYVPPVYETRYVQRGHRAEAVQVLVRDGYYQKVVVPAQYETRTTRVWVPDPTPVVYAPSAACPTPVVVAPRHDDGVAFRIGFDFRK